MAGLDESDVAAFLSANPDFTQKWVVDNLLQETVQGWYEEKLNESPIPSSSYLSRARKSFAPSMLEDYMGKKDLLKRRVSITSSIDNSSIMELIRDIANGLDIDILCHKILRNICRLTNADRASLFLVRTVQGRKFLYSKLFDVTKNSLLDDTTLHNEHNEIEIPFGKGIAGFVAQTKKPFNLKDASQDKRFNREVDKKTGYETNSMVCVPILKYESEGDVLGVASILNKKATKSQFTPEDEEVFAFYLTFCGIGINNAQLFEISVEEYKRNQLLVKLAEGLFSEQQHLDKLVTKIISEAQYLLKCQRCNVYLLESAILTENLMDQGMYKEAHDNIMSAKRGSQWTQNIMVKHNAALSELKIRDTSGSEDIWKFGKVFQLNVNRDGLHGNVKTLKIDQILENSELLKTAREVCVTYKAESQSGNNFGLMLSERLRDYDGLHVHECLTIPIVNEEKKPVGVVQLINKLNGKSFLTHDINILEVFTIFCGLGIHNCLMYEAACKLMAKQAVALELLSFHSSATSEETHQLMDMQLPEPDKIQLFQFDFIDWDLSEMNTCASVVQLFVSAGMVQKYRIAYETLCTWVLTVKKNYRPNSYHNWRHALNVCQMMYVLCYKCDMKRWFDDLDVFALLVACLCHDLDHRGTDNKFQSKIDSPLAKLYTTSTLEHHHFDMCVMILSSEGNNIFANLTSAEYISALKSVQSAILSTDLSVYVKNEAMFVEMVKKGEKHWKGEEKKNMLMSMLMTAADLSGVAKPWHIQQKVAHLITAEFLLQGDFERDILHEDQIQANMDRKQKQLLPKLQIGFLRFCLPIYEALYKLESKLKPLLDGVKSNMKHWDDLGKEYETGQHRSDEPNGASTSFNKSNENDSSRYYVIKANRTD